MKSKQLLAILALSFTLFFIPLIGISAIDFAKLSNFALQQYGPEAKKTLMDLSQLIATLRLADEQTKVKKINDFINANITFFVPDIEIWGEKDYWATPLEALGRKSGDCEDYSIAKYLLLKELNIPNKQLKITYVRAQIANEGGNEVLAHMVLSYYPQNSSEPLILDNLTPDILTASNRPDLTPIYSFNSEGLWVGNSTQQKGNATSHLSRWRDLLIRIKNDGFN